jgi:hypothetical protein
MNKALIDDLFKIQTGVPTTEAIDTAAHLATLHEMEKILYAEKALYDKLYIQRMEWITNGGLIMSRFRVEQIKATYPGYAIEIVTKDRPAALKQGKTVWIDEKGVIINVRE